MPCTSVLWMCTQLNAKTCLHHSTIHRGKTFISSAVAELLYIFEIRHCDKDFKLTRDQSATPLNYFSVICKTCRLPNVKSTHQHVNGDAILIKIGGKVVLKKLALHGAVSMESL